MPDSKPISDTFRPLSPFLAMLDVAGELRRIDKLGHDIRAAEARLEAMLEWLRPVLERQPGGIAQHVQRAAERGDEMVIVAIEDDGSISARTEPILSLVDVEWPDATADGAGADDALDGLDRALAAGFQSVNPRVTPVSVTLCEENA